MDTPSIISNNDFSYSQYKNLVDKCIEQNDTREVTLQGDVVKHFINKLCANLDIADVSYKGPVGTQTNYHDYLQYCGTYKDNNKDKATTPDLVIAQNWNWHNIQNKVDYCAVVEVKSFKGEQPVFNKEFKNYDAKLKKQLERHLSARENKKVILTDCLKWEFYISDNPICNNDLIPIKTISLTDFQKGRKRIDWEWKEGRNEKIENGVINDIFNKGIEYEEEPKEFKELKKYLVRFLSKGKEFNLAYPVDDGLT